MHTDTGQINLIMGIPDMIMLLFLAFLSHSYFVPRPQKTILRHSYMPQMPHDRRPVGHVPDMYLFC